MKTAIMQPYFLPYIGYFQLIKAVDTFVIYDDVNYIKQGWIKRHKSKKGKESRSNVKELEAELKDVRLENRILKEL